MPPKQAAKVTARSIKKMEAEIKQFLEEHRRESEAIYQSLLQKAEATFFTLRDDLEEAARAILPKEVLEANLMEFLRNNDVSEERVQEGVVQQKEGCSAENMIDIASDAVAAFENLSIPVEKTPASKVEEVESVRTPLQEHVSVTNVPSVIHPKVEEMRANRFRVARGDEVAFSVDGSPLVVLTTEPNDPAAVVFKQMIEGDEDTFSPNSREVVSTFKSLMRQKMAEAQARSQELD